MQYHVLLSWAKATFNSFHIQMRKKNPIQTGRETESEREREIKRMGRCWHVYRQQQSPGVNMRDGEWHATEKRRRHTGVSEHSAPGPMVEWCLRDKAEVYKPCRAPQGPRRLSFHLAFPLCSCTASQTEQAAMDIPGNASEWPPSSASLWWIYRWSSARRSRTATKGGHESFNCNVLGHTKINKKNRNIDLQCISARPLMVAFALLILFSNYDSA